MPALDKVQFHALVFAPFGNQNRDDVGLPKTMDMLGSMRGRWSAQSQKAAVRASAFLEGMGVGVRSRNLPIETYERLRAAGLPERLCFAGTEVVRSGLGNGALRKPAEAISGIVKAVFLDRWGDAPDVLQAAIPALQARKPKPRKGEEVAEGAEEAAEGRAGGRAAEGAARDALVSLLLGSKEAGSRDAKGTWPGAWAHEADVVGQLTEADPALRGALLEVFRSDQPLLYSRQELAWKERLEDALAAAWKTGGAAAVGDVLESFAPKGRVDSPMPREAIDIDIALFGRMVANEPAATVEAALSMNHSMTVGEFHVQDDYFTAREERPRRGDDKVGHIGRSFWGTGIHYRYAEINMHLLRRNLEIGGRLPSEAAELAERGLADVLRSLATSLPRGRAANSAPFSPAAYVMVERGSAPSTNLSLAFSAPIQGGCDDPVGEAISRLKAAKQAMSRVYGCGRILEICAHPAAERRVPDACQSLEELIAGIAR